MEVTFDSNDMETEDKVAVVTGSHKGIGAAVVKRFLAGGYIVVHCDIATPSPHPETNRCSFVQCDVSVEAEVEAVIDTAFFRHQRIDCLINNVGVHPPPHSIEEFSLADLRRLFSINFDAIFVACRRAIPHLRKSKGNIVNLSSLVGTMGQPLACTYAATKGAIISFTKALAIDEAAHDVRVNSVSPSNVWTGMWDEALARAEDPDATLRFGEGSQVMGRMAAPAEIAEMVFFVATAATFSTGVDHLVTGGAELSYGLKSRKGAAPSW